MLAGNVRDVQKSQVLVKIAAGWLLGLMLAVAAAVVAVNVVNGSMASPQQPVREYLAALQNGEGGKALGILRASVPESDASMLDGTALQTAANRVSDVTVGDAEDRPENQVMVPVDYTVNGTQLRTEFLLEKTGTEWLFFNTWAFVPAALPTVDVSVVNAVEATVNGVPVNMPQGKNTFAVFYPGEYEAALKGKYFSATPSKAAVTDRAAPAAALNLLTTATEALRKEVSGKVNGFLDDCAAKATEDQRLQPNCPFYQVNNNSVIPGSIKWAVTTYPEISVDPFDGRWVVAPLDGKATVTGRQVDLFTGVEFPLDEAVPFSFTTRLDVAGNTITVTPIVNF